MKLFVSCLHSDVSLLRSSCPPTPVSLPPPFFLFSCLSSLLSYSLPFHFPLEWCFMKEESVFRSPFYPWYQHIAWHRGGAQMNVCWMNPWPSTFCLLFKSLFWFPPLKILLLSSFILLPLFFSLSSYLLPLFAPFPTHSPPLPVPTPSCHYSVLLPGGDFSQRIGLPSSFFLLPVVEPLNYLFH